MSTYLTLTNLSLGIINYKNLNVNLPNSYKFLTWNNLLQNLNVNLPNSYKFLTRNNLLQKFKCQLT